MCVRAKLELNSAGMFDTPDFEDRQGPLVVRERYCRRSYDTFAAVVNKQTNKQTNKKHFKRLSLDKGFFNS